jgi:hypothetical protein
MAHSRSSCLNNIIKVHKDSLEKFSRSGVVYHIRDCNAPKWGNLKDNSKRGYISHESDIKRSNSPSVITRHRLEYNHEFDWGNVRIVDNKNSYYKRLTSEHV